MYQLIKLYLLRMRSFLCVPFKRVGFILREREPKGRILPAPCIPTLMGRTGATQTSARKPRWHHCLGQQDTCRRRVSVHPTFFHSFPLKTASPKHWAREGSGEARPPALPSSEGRQDALENVGSSMSLFLCWQGHGVDEEMGKFGMCLHAWTHNER